jgi:hypothetical protein
MRASTSASAKRSRAANSAASFSFAACGSVELGDRAARVGARLDHLHGLGELLERDARRRRGGRPPQPPVPAAAALAGCSGVASASV